MSRMLDFQTLYDEERNKYEKRHAALRAHRDFLKFGNSLVDHWTNSNLDGQACLNERQGSIRYYDSLGNESMDIDLWLTKENTKKDIFKCFNWIHSQHNFRDKSWTRKYEAPEAHQMYWEYTFTQKREHPIPKLEQRRRIEIKFHLNHAGVCKRIKTGTKTNTIDVYEIKCD